MSNRLIKRKTFVRGTSGQPYRPPQPARTAFESRKVCGYQYNGPANSSSGYYQTVHDKATGATFQVWVPNIQPDVPNGGYQYVCSTQTVQVNYPADPGQPFVAETPSRTDYNLGWNAGARSLKFFTGNGNATFKARSTVVGAYVGLNGFESPLSLTGASIAFGFYIARGTARVVEQGVIRAAVFGYTDATVFKVARAAGQITYYADATLVYTSEVDDSTEPLWLQAALYSGDDEIFDPVLTQVSSADTSPVTGELSLTLSPLALSARAGDGGALRLALPPPVPAMSRGLAEPSYALLNLVLAPITPSVYALTGVVGELALTLPAPGAFIAERQTGRVALDLPQTWMRAFSWPYDTIQVDGRLLLNSTSGLRLTATLPTEPLSAVVGGSIGSYAEVTLQTVALAGLLSGSIGAVGEVTLPQAAFRAVLGGSIGILSGLNEVFVLNMTGGKPGGTTTYSGFDFNSFAKIGGRYYGAREDGLYLLEGEDDAGLPIDASFGFGQLSLGNPQKKTVTHAYLGAAAGAMRVTVESLLDGRPVKFTYAARGHGATMREVRFALGKGLKSTYVMPTFSNHDGDPFEVDTVAFLVNDLARKV